MTSRLIMLAVVKETLEVPFGEDQVGEEIVLPTMVEVGENQETKDGEENLSRNVFTVNPSIILRKIAHMFTCVNGAGNQGIQLEYANQHPQFHHLL